MISAGYFVRTRLVQGITPPASSSPTFPAYSSDTFSGYRFSPSRGLSTHCRACRSSPVPRGPKSCRSFPGRARVAHTTGATTLFFFHPSCFVKRLVKSSCFIVSCSLNLTVETHWRSWHFLECFDESSVSHASRRRHFVVSSTVVLHTSRTRIFHQKYYCVYVEKKIRYCFFPFKPQKRSINSL